MAAFFIGFGLGFLVAMQLGPLSLFLIRSTIRGTLAVGLAIGAGVAVIDTLYAAAGAAGAASLLTIDALRLALGAIGAVVLAVIGVRTLWSAFRVRLGGESEQEVATPGRAFLTSLAATASNPLTIASWAAVFAVASTASVTSSSADTVALLAGVGTGSLTWVTVLACIAAFAGRFVGDRVLRVVDGVAGAGLIGFGGLLAWRSAEDA
jgi:putative LysE/RhtB family amino acid efflux pump